MSSSPHPASYNSPPITVVLAVIILVFFFFGFFSVYLCRCVMGSVLRAWHFRRAPSGGGVPAGVGCPGASQGLHPSHIQAFPSFKYSSVKDLRRDKYGLECAICLSEFDPDSLLRLLTLCCHVFHQECIDLWLEFHNTCPVCRRVLDKPSPAPSSENAAQDDDAVAIDIDLRDDHDHDINEDGLGGDEDRQEESGSGRIGLSRSNTTGHSIVRSREEEDRYTLRLPEHVKIRLLRGHNWTGSCTTFDDMAKNKASGRFCGGEDHGDRTTS